MGYSYKILKNGELTVYQSGNVVCFITNVHGKTIEDKIDYFNRVIKD